MTCIEKWILYNSLWWSAQWLDQEEAPKYCPKPNLHHRKVIVTVWWFTSSVIHYSFLNPSENITSEKYAQQIGEMHRTLQHRSWHWSTERVQFFSTTIPKCTLHNQGLNSWMNWAVKFASFAIFTWRLANQLPLLQTSWQLFAEKTLPQPAGGTKCFPRVCQVLKHRFSCYGNKQTFRIAKTCWLKLFIFWLITMCLSLIIMS